MQYRSVSRSRAEFVMQQIASCGIQSIQGPLDFHDIAGELNIRAVGLDWAVVSPR